MMIRLFRVSIPSSVLALLLSEAVLVFSCYVLAAYVTLEFSADVFLFDDGGLSRIGLVAALVIFGLYFSDLYDNYRIRSRIALVQQFCVIIGVAFLSQALLGYGRWDIMLPKWTMVYGSMFVIVALPLWRIAFMSVVWNALGAQKLLFLGTSPIVKEIAQRIIERPELGMVPVGFLNHGESATLPGEIGLIGGLADLKTVTQRLHPDRIVVGMSERRGLLPIQELLELRFAGVHIEDAATTYESVFGRVSTLELHPSQLVFSEELGPKPAMVQLQSFYSWALGALGCILALPVMILVALVVRFSSRGPVFYRQTRAGMNGVPFMLYKFRSMHQHAEAGTGAVWAVKDDPRITPVGRWLRKLRLDELPQLLNVIRGEMSLVGPRPERPEFVGVLQEKIPYYQHRLCVKPGITGWAQINHKYGDTIEDTIIKLEFDLYYIKNLAPSLDVYIIFHTMKTVLLGRGAQ